MPENLRLLLADDDRDDRFFFNKAIQALPIIPTLTMVEDGEKLMHYLFENVDQLPDLLFLDLNMPRKNGSECLIEIKQHNTLKELPVVIYSTALYDELANQLYKNGAHYFMRKSNMQELQIALAGLLSLVVETKFSRPPRDQFIYGR